MARKIILKLLLLLMWATLVRKSEEDQILNKHTKITKPGEGFIVELFVLKVEGPKVANVFPSSAENYLTRKILEADTGFFQKGLEWNYEKTWLQVPGP